MKLNSLSRSKSTLQMLHFFILLLLGWLCTAGILLLAFTAESVPLILLGISVAWLIARKATYVFFQIKL